MANLLFTRNSIALVCLSMASSFAAPPTPDSTIRIVSDAMDCDQEKNICTATGNAFADRPNDPDKRTLRAHKFIAHFKKSESTGSTTGKTDLSKLEAIGEVVLTDKDSIILCDKAVYDHPTEEVDLFENVKITNDQNQLNGSYGHADLKTKKYRVTNRTGQVEGLFVNSKKKEKA